MPYHALAFESFFFWFKGTIDLFAVDFCVRYQDRCPKEPVPAEPVNFHHKDEGHIYTREIEFWCTRTKRTAYNYCTEPDLLKVYKYAMFCV
ncbi:hypothetical protein CAEBREN_11538 [Caenorhabditis brenneri]|uniref:Uncharacterized protein n=1 Tax=Caenorhabditis brenneri TaxID=135651 RepID=G0NW50_CAEBE|nr:hypothetical protein CAEBREN_11538 [Caenorhabditis brenneri]